MRRCCWYIYAVDVRLGPANAFPLCRDSGDNWAIGCRVTLQGGPIVNAAAIGLYIKMKWGITRLAEGRESISSAYRGVDSEKM